MTRRLIVIAAAAIALAAALTVFYRTTHRTGMPTVVTVPVSRGDVIETVDATGTLQAVTTVQVGTQVSGTIKALHADFNARVRRGQVIAELEPSLFETQVEQARASVARLEAESMRARTQREDARRKLARAQELARGGLIPAVDLETAEMNLRESEAAVLSIDAQAAQARASLRQSEVNLAHTIITAPIDGIVISRNVDVGQTVAASMQAPTLFVLARDLTRMQVNASIAESDIGRIEPGQPVSFRVDAYPGEVFSGRVAQVRLDAVVQQNVVSYVTTVDVPNQDLKLKPGMTATVTVEIARAAGVLRVPNAALRVRPSADVLAALGQVPESHTAAVTPADSGRERGTSGVRDAIPQRPSGPAETVASGPADGRPAEVWVQRDGGLERVPVRVGISDGSQTAVLAGALREDAPVVTSVTAATSGTSPASGSPLLPFGGRLPGGRGAGSRRPGS